MRELAHGTRQTGRTTKLLTSMIQDMEGNDSTFYLVIGPHSVKLYINDLLKKLNADLSRIKIISVENLFAVRGVDVLNIYFEHTAYEYADSRQLQSIYTIEDRKDAMFFMEKIK